MEKAGAHRVADAGVQSRPTKWVPLGVCVQLVGVVGWDVM